MIRTSSSHLEPNGDNDTDKISNNIIHYVEAFKPNKAAALDYLSNSSIKVDKYAHVRLIPDPRGDEVPR